MGGAATWTHVDNAYSTGGILALAFGDRGWSLEECDERFSELVLQAFSPQQGQGIPWISQVQSVLKSKYRTRPLELALQDAFSPDENLFGRRRCDDTDHPKRLKVAVTSVSNGGDTAFVISNYNTRNESRGSGPRYRRYRPDRAEDEIKVWEAYVSLSHCRDNISLTATPERELRQPPQASSGLTQKTSHCRLGKTEIRSSLN